MYSAAAELSAEVQLLLHHINLKKKKEGFFSFSLKIPSCFYDFFGTKNTHSWSKIFFLFETVAVFCFVPSFRIFMEAFVNTAAE